MSNRVRSRKWPDSNQRVSEKTGTVQGQAGPTVGQSIANFDFESRYDRLAYHTNQFGPFTLAASSSPIE
jgi:hypothetical protein